MDLSENMEEKMVEMCEEKGLIVVGYSGNDLSIMNPIRENLRKNKKFLPKGLHWCVHRSSTKNKQKDYIDEHEVPNLLREIRKRHPDRVFLYSVSGFDEFMESTFTQSSLALPPSVEMPYENNVANEFYKSCQNLEFYTKLNRTVRSHMVRALECMEETPDKIEFKMRRADQIWADGAYLRDEESDYENATRKFEESIELIDGLLKDEELNKVRKIKSTKRKVGCLVGLAKVADKQGKATNSLLDQAFKLANSILVENSSEISNDELSELVSLQFNTLCALGFRVHLAGKITPKIEQQVKDVVSEMQTTNKGRAKLEKLLEEQEIKGIYELIDPNET